ncbi:MAG TPA: hypothetical protein VGL12_16025 [Roseiarcus sp.]
MDSALSSERVVWIELIADALVAVVKLCAALFTFRARRWRLKPPIPLLTSEAAA